MSIRELLLSAQEGKLLDQNDAITLLNADYQTDDFYKLLSTANYLSRTEYDNKGLVFAQIGINAALFSQLQILFNGTRPLFSTGYRKKKHK